LRQLQDTACRTEKERKRKEKGEREEAFSLLTEVKSEPGIGMTADRIRGVVEKASLASTSHRSLGRWSWLSGQ